MRPVFDLVEHEVKIETVPQRVARAALQLDETGVNGSSFHAQTGQFRHDERGSRPVQIPSCFVQQQPIYSMWS
jgi:hypothetical protein